MSTHTVVAPTQTAAKPAITAAPAVLLQRTCNCGEHTLGSEECDDCKKKKLTLHRRATNSFAPRFAPAMVHDVLRSSGQPLDRGTRAFMEPRFGRDLGHVRIHIDAVASESARAVNALAYTVNNHIAFQAGNYDPASPQGRRLLAHELTHVVQNRNHAGTLQCSLPEISDPADASEREANNVAEQVVSGETAKVAQAPDAFVHRELDPNTKAALTDVGIGAAIVGGLAAIAGVMYLAGVFITENQLREYLKRLDDTNKIEGGWISDIKARRIADSWGKGETKFVVTIRRRALLILEMLDGHVSHWDKDGIMNILERSEDVALEYIFGAGGVSHPKLIAALDSWKDEVRRFYKRRYSINDIYAQKDFSKLKAQSTGPIQPGDEIPQEDKDEFFKPINETKRRTKPVEAEESDKWVTEAYGPYLAKEKTGGQFIQKNVEIKVAQESEPGAADAEFQAALQPHCQKVKKYNTAEKRKEKDGQPLSQEELRQIQDQYRYCMENPDVAAFYESAQEAEEPKAQIHVHGLRESASTRLHEALHAYANPDVSSSAKFPHFASEGMTEYFTRQIALRKNLAISRSYEGPFLAIQEFSAQFGENTLAQVYFQGKLDLICKSLVGRFGTGAYTDWATAMSAEDSWADAVKVMQRPKPSQPPDFSECPAAT